MNNFILGITHNIQKTISALYVQNGLLLSMSKELLICERFTWSPEPAKNPIGRMSVKEGKNLPNSMEEDVGSFLLAPTYSTRQLRHINRIHRDKVKDTRKKIRHENRRKYHD